MAGLINPPQIVYHKTMFSATAVFGHRCPCIFPATPLHAVRAYPHAKARAAIFFLKEVLSISTHRRNSSPALSPP